MRMLYGYFMNLKLFLHSWHLVLVCAWHSNLYEKIKYLEIAFKANATQSNPWIQGSGTWTMPHLLFTKRINSILYVKRLKLTHFNLVLCACCCCFFFRKAKYVGGKYLWRCMWYLYLNLYTLTRFILKLW